MKNKTKEIFSIKVWLILFLAINMIFAFYHTTFFWGNHDWDWVKGTTQVLRLNTGMFEGRYAKFILNVGLFGGQILPVLNNLVAFALLSLGAVFLTSYWQIKPMPARILVALIPITAPYILGWLYFPINIIGNFSATALVAYGLFAATKKNWKHQVLSASCFLIALGVYPSVAEMMIICLCMRFIMVALPRKEDIIPAATPVIIAMIAFKLLLFILGKLDIIYSAHYNMQTPDIEELIKRIPAVMALAFNQLWTTLPFFTLGYKILAILLLICAVIITYKKSLWWIIAFSSTVLSTFLTAAPEETAYMPRINFYGLNFLIAGAAAVLLNNRALYRNIGNLLCVLLIWGGIKANIEATKVWQLGKIAESALVERISDRIEQQAPDKILIPVIAGELPLRPRYYATPYQKSSTYILSGSLLVRHIPSGMFNFYAVTPLFYNYSQIADLSPALYNFIKTTERPWPAPESLWIDEKYAIIMLTQAGITAIQAQLPY